MTGAALAARALAEPAIQHSLIAEGLANSIHPERPRSMGVLLDGHPDRITLYGNLIASNRKRNPRLTGGSSEIVIANNVIYGWGNPNGGAIVFGSADDGPFTDVVFWNNLFRLSAESNARRPVEIVNGSLDPRSTIFMEGNFYPADDPIPALDVDAIRREVPLPLLDASPITLAEANLERIARSDTILSEVLAEAGATRPALDSFDERVRLQVQMNAGAVVDTPGDYPAYPTTAPPADADGDGIPDAVESTNGLDPNDPGDAQNTAPSGYTALERYHQELAGDL